MDGGDIVKKVYLIGGTMGVGKTSVCKILSRQKLKNSVFLDGDWCWYSSPFIVTKETRKLMIDNICHLLNNYIQCSIFENIVFCWVMDNQRTIDDIIAALDTTDCRVLSISLICSAEELTARINRDIETGIRNAKALERSLARLSRYNNLNTLKIDTSYKTANEIADELSTL